MKIVILEHPRLASKHHFNDIASTPLWSCLMGGYAAAALEHVGYPATLLDHAEPGATFAASLQAMLAEAPDLLAVNAVYFWEDTGRLFEFFETLRGLGFTGHLNLFGFFPSLAYRQILDSAAGVDSVAVGEFEHTLTELAARLAAGSAWNDIAGLAVRAAGNIAFRPRPVEKAPETFPFPRRVRLAAPITLLGSRGCYNHCSFCLVPAFDGRGGRWRGRPPADIAREIERLMESGIRDFYFADPNFIGPGRAGRERTRELLERIRPLGIAFGMETRANDLDREMMAALVRAGLKSLLIGIESGSPDILARLDKSARIDDGARAIRICREHSIEPEIGFLMFVPEATFTDLRANLEFLTRNSLLSRLDRTANLLSHRQIVLAGTSGYTRYADRNQLAKKGLFGFQGEVALACPRMEWLAELTIFACHTILGKMGEPDSPVYWRKTASPTFQSANDYLVRLFHRLLEEASASAGLASIASGREAIVREIHRIIRL